MINSYSNPGSEVVQKDNVSINFVGNMIEKGVPGLPSSNKFHSIFTLIGWNEGALDSIVTNFSKQKRTVQIQQLMCVTYHF